MNVCITSECPNLKLPGRGRRYCGACRLLADERTRKDAARRKRAWAQANPDKKRELDRRKQARQRENPRPCLIAECSRPAGVPGTAHGYCSKHYHRWRRTGDPYGSLRVLQDPVCSVDGCDKSKWAQGLCPMHLHRFKTHGDTGSAESSYQRVDGPCCISGCERLCRVGDLCQGHYLRKLRYGDPLAGKPSPRPGARCDIESCGRKHYARGMCNWHWQNAIGRPLRRRRLKDAPGHSTAAQLNARIAYFGGRCWLCGADYEEIDHVKPLSRGGSNWPSNLRPVCKSCNCRKRSRWFGPARLAEVA